MSANVNKILVEIKYNPSLMEERQEIMTSLTHFYLLAKYKKLGNTLKTLK